jgi:hypothetical protein
MKEGGRRKARRRKTEREPKNKALVGSSPTLLPLDIAMDDVQAMQVFNGTKQP